MPRYSTVAARLMILSVAVALGANAAGQGQQPLLESLKGEKDDRPDLRAARSPDLEKALESPAHLVAYVTVPQTPYLERLAAVVQGARFVPVEQMPTVLEDLDELRAEEAIHNWGLLPNPHAARPQRVRTSAAPDPRRTVLGRPWTLPPQPTPFPLTWEQESRAPWPWQVEQALDAMVNAMVPTYGNIVAEQRWLDVALTMPCDTDAQANRFVVATTLASRLKTPAVMKRWLELAGNSQMPVTQACIARSLGEAVRLWDDDRAEWLGQLVGLALLEHGSSDAKLNAAWGMPHMRKRFTKSGTEIERPVPASCVLAAARLALDPSTGDEWTRLYSFAFPVCSTVDGPPFKADPRMDPRSPLVAQRLRQFSEWFNRAEPDLQAQAARESAEARQ